ncbi:hypothetical protein CEXT_306991 [Caerostris extrusa]|uniref:Uncharacterized protein n=1 Tax=Caerostris extrusa TaxID=172846 RepID=A0AAV4XTK8_CAEEX|nr:hypothetical protein CEXT_306991 [Caerostris extrusa]
MLQINYGFICSLSIGNKITQFINRTNKALQQEDLSIDYGTKLIAGLRSTLQELRDKVFEQNFHEEQNLAEEICIEKRFLNKRRRGVKIIKIDENTR